VLDAAKTGPVYSLDCLEDVNHEFVLTWVGGDVMQSVFVSAGAMEACFDA
jgi:hypothetical protein